jgi:hypothetical protein
MALVKIAADKRHLVNPRGAPFFVLGVNYAGYFDRAWQMWEPDKFSPELIARDFKKAQGSGFNVIRLFVHTALQKQLQQNDFSRLDHVLSMAQDHQLLVLLSLNDSHSLNLAQTAAIDAKIATRYKDVPTMLGYDLENEPVFYNLAAAIYPANYPAPLHSRQLVDHYGERVSRAEAASLQQQRKIPAHLNPEQAYFYINALRLFLEYDAAVNAFVGQGKGTLVDFNRSAQAERWQPLITVLDGTVQAWLRARLDPLRAAGCQQLLTVGWNWLHFAGLPANRLLDFQSYHNYGSLNRPGFAANIAHLESLTGAFPNHPILFTEFGWSNHSSTNPAGSRPVDPHLTALYESATYAYLRANDFGGGFKWMLNDVQITHNPYEASFGLFSVGDRPKPVRDVLNRVSQEWPAVDQAARFKSRQDFDNHLAYRFDAPGQITLGGRTYQDDALHWQGQGPAHCFLKVVNGELWVDALGAGRLAVLPWQIIPGWNRARETNLFRVLPGSPRTRQQVFGAGQAVEFDMQAGVQYALVMGAQVPTTTPPPDAPQVDPQPGEHVLLLANADEYLPAALKYIRRFAPDFTFAAAEVAGRWAYVTVVAPPEVVPETTIDAIRGAGVQLVERVVSSTPTETRARLDEMARLGRRFVNATAPAPPQTEPPSAPGPDQPAPPPTPAPPQSYTVKPGDTLSKIAQVVYGDFRLWPLIFEANRDQLVNPSLIRVGMVLHIPPRN